MKVSVIIITYNHEQYIAQAIESVLAQETDFDFELLISEDCSTDATREVLSEYEQRHPDRIRLLLSARNLCTNSVLTRAIAQARGDYIAMFDGDDFWTSPAKLQKQADYLDANPGCALCFHNVQVYYGDRPQASHPFHLDEAGVEHWLPRPKPVSTRRDLIARNIIPTCSVMFRAGLIPAFPDWYDGFPVGDWPLYLMLTAHGDAGYLPEVMAAYRQHGQSYWSGGRAQGRTLESLDWMIRVQETKREIVEREYWFLMNPDLAALYYRAMQLAVREQDSVRAGKYAESYLSLLPPRRWIVERQAIRNAMKARLPRLHRVVRAIRNLTISRQPESRTGGRRDHQSS